MYFFGGLGNIIGPFIVGTIYDATNSYDYACYMAGACMFLGGAFNEVSHLVWTKMKKNNKGER